MKAEEGSARQLWFYLRFQWRLIGLNHRLAGKSWWQETLASRFLGRIRLTPGWAGGATVTAGTLLPIFAVMVLGITFAQAVHPGFFDLAREDSGRWLTAWTRWQPLALILSCAYIASESVNGIFRVAGYANLYRAMELASANLARVGMLATYWQRGRRNNDFLQELFVCHEPLRERILQSGYDVENMRDRSCGPLHGRLAGVWILPTSPLLTEVVKNATDAEVVAEEETDLVERRLLPYARTDHADVRTCFLAQWQRLRRGADALSKEDLKQHCWKVEEGLNYIVRRLALVDGRIIVEVDRAGYGQIMRSCDYLIEEAFLAAGICAGKHPGEQPLQLRGRWLLRTLPGRRTVIQLGADEILCQPRRRAVGIGIAAVTVTRPVGGVPCLRYKRRSFEVGTYPDMYHVVPTGMFNSKTRHSRTMHDQRVHLGQVLLTELLEETKNAKDLDGFDANPFWRELLQTHLAWLFRDPAAYHAWQRGGRKEQGIGAERLARIQAAIAASTGEVASSLDQLRIWVTGIAFDLLSLRPEICCVIELPDGPVSEVHLNEEGEDWSPFPTKDTPTVAQLPPSSDWVRSGYAAMMLAHDAVGAGLDSRAATTPADIEL